MASGTDKVEVPIESGWKSKINWTQLVGFAMNAITAYSGYKFNLTADQIVNVLVALNAAQGGLTFVFRQFFTKSVTPSSAGK